MESSESLCVQVDTPKRQQIEAFEEMNVSGQI